MADNEKSKRNRDSVDQAEQSIFDLFEPPPDPDPGSFGKVPVVREDEIDLTDQGSPSVEVKAAADVEAAGLQHWTAPATGQVPAVLSSDGEESGLWADVKGPSWHGDDPSWAGPDLADVFADTDSINLGNSDDDYDDLDDEDDDHYGEIHYREAPEFGADLGGQPASEFGVGRGGQTDPELGFGGGLSSRTEPKHGVGGGLTSRTDPSGRVGRGVSGRTDPGNGFGGSQSGSDPGAGTGLSSRTDPNRPAPSHRSEPPVARRSPPAGQARDNGHRVPLVSDDLTAPAPRPVGRPAVQSRVESVEGRPPPRIERGPQPTPSPHEPDPAPMVDARGRTVGARPSRLGIERNDANPDRTSERSLPSPPPVRRPEGLTAGGPRETPEPVEERPSVFSDANRGRPPHTPLLGGEPTAAQPRPPVLREERNPGRQVFSGNEPPALDDIEFAEDEYDEEYYEEDEELAEEFGLGESTGRNLPAAIAVGVGLAAVVLAAMFFGPDTTMLVVGVLTLLAVLEVYNAMRMAGLRPATLLGVVGAVAAPAAAYYRGDAAFPLIVALAVVFGVLWYLVGADSERPVLNFSLTMMGIFWVGGLAAFAALILGASGGVELLLATIIITVASDTLAYVGGRAYGTRPFHQASPSKTWEGTFTGFAAAVFAGFAIGVTGMGTIWDDHFVAAIVLGAVVGILVPIGDLAESVVKRDLGIKDMGTLLPGHGGVMDRIDGLLFALPGAYYLALIYGVL